jgi:phosphoribosyl 1,2-cyclic phosphodiesterase
MAVADDGQTQIILDLGVTWNQVRLYLDFETSRVSGILVTHSHGDHVRGVKDALKNSFDCWMSAETATALGLPIKDGDRPHRLHLIKPMQSEVIGSWEVEAFDVEHDAPGALGFRLDNAIGERLYYIADTAYVRYLLPGANVIAIECNYSLVMLRSSVSSGVINRAVKRRIMESHFSLENVITMLKANDLSKLQAIYLLHLSENNADREEFKKRVQEATGVPVYV